MALNDTPDGTDLAMGSMTRILFAGTPLANQP
jgi:hypothetical protein